MMQRGEAGRVLLLIDGLGYETAVRHCGYLEGLVQAGAARRWRMRTALPSLSRPLYETVLTGLAPHDHGVTSNDVCRLSRVDHVFAGARGRQPMPGSPSFTTGPPSTRGGTSSATTRQSPFSMGAFISTRAIRIAIFSTRLPR